MLNKRKDKTLHWSHFVGFRASGVGFGVANVGFGAAGVGLGGQFCKYWGSDVRNVGLLAAEPFHPPSADSSELSFSVCVYVCVCVVCVCVGGGYVCVCVFVWECKQLLDYFIKLPF